MKTKLPKAQKGKQVPYSWFQGPATQDNQQTNVGVNPAKIAEKIAAEEKEIADVQRKEKVSRDVAKNLIYVRKYGKSPQIKPDTRFDYQKQYGVQKIKEMRKQQEEAGRDPNMSQEEFDRNTKRTEKIINNIVTPIEVASTLTGVGSIGSNFARLTASQLEKQVGKNLVSKTLKNVTNYTNPFFNTVDDTLAYAQLDPIGIMGNKLNAKMFNPTTAINRTNNTITGVGRNLTNSAIEGADLVAGTNNTENITNQFNLFRRSGSKTKDLQEIVDPETGISTFVPKITKRPAASLYQRDDMGLYKDVAGRRSYVLDSQPEAYSYQPLVVPPERRFEWPTLNTNTDWNVTNNRSLFDKVSSRIRTGVDRLDQKLGKMVSDVKPVPEYNPEDVLATINENLSKGMGVKKSTLPLKVEIGTGTGGNTLRLRTVVQDQPVGDIVLKRNIDPYTEPKKLSQILFGNKTNDPRTAWRNTEGFKKSMDFPFDDYDNTVPIQDVNGRVFTNADDFFSLGLSGEFNKAINEALKSKKLGNILSGGTGHSELGAKRWENLVQKGLAHKFGSSDQGYYMLKKQGGMIVDPRGQWAHPGKPTRIPGGDITMQGVPYPVLAKANNGQTQMMYPGQEYEFPGAEYVDEYPMMGGGGYVVTRSNDRKGKTHKVTGPDGTVKYFGDSKLGQHPKDPERKKAFYARHKQNLENNPFFRAFARKTWEEGGEYMEQMQQGGQRQPIVVNDPNDPRLRAYQDSLNLHNNSYDLYKRVKATRWPVEMESRAPKDNERIRKNQEDINPFLRLKYLNEVKPERVKVMAPTGSNQKVINVRDASGKTLHEGKISGHNTVFLFKKPVQPVVFQQQPDLNTVGTTQQMFDGSLQAPAVANRVSVPATKQSQYSATFGNRGNQKTIYFPDYDAWKQFDASQRGTMNWMSAQEAGDRSSASTLLLEEMAEGGDYQGSSIVDYLATRGYSGKKSFRKDLASKYGVEDYDFSAKKNLELLRRLRENDDALETYTPSFAPIPVERLEQMYAEQQRPVSKPVQQRPRPVSAAPVQTPAPVAPKQKSTGWRFDQAPVPVNQYAPKPFGFTTPSFFTNTPPPTAAVTPAVVKPKTAQLPKVDVDRITGKTYLKPGVAGVQPQSKKTEVNTESEDDQPWYSQLWDRFQTTFNAPQWNGINLGSGFNAEGAKSVTKDVTGKVLNAVSPDLAQKFDNYQIRQNALNNMSADPKSTFDLTKVKFDPAYATGDTLWDDKRKYHIPESMDINYMRFGTRNRGDLTEINTEAAPITTFHPFESARSYFTKSKDPANATYIGVSPDGHMKIGSRKDFENQDYQVTRTFSNKVVDFVRDASGQIKRTEAGDKVSKKAFSPVITVIGDDGKIKEGKMNLVLPKDDPKAEEAFGVATGGRYIFQSPDGRTRFVSGSLKNIADEFKRFKGNDPYVNVITLDNGSYSRALRTKDQKLTGKDLRSYDNLNTSGGNFAYLLPGQPKNRPDVKFADFEKQATNLLQSQFPGKKVEVRFQNEGVYDKKGGRDITTQEGIQKAGNSQTPVSLHNFDAAKDYVLYVDGKMIDPDKQKDIYKKVLWGAADKTGMYHLEDWDPAHISLAKEGQKTAFDELYAKYPDLFISPNFQKSYDYIMKNKDNPRFREIYKLLTDIQPFTGKPRAVKEEGGEVIRRADGSYSRRGLWDNIRANKGSGKKPTKEMLEQERKIRAAEKQLGGLIDNNEMFTYYNPYMADGGYVGYDGKVHYSKTPTWAGNIGYQIGGQLPKAQFGNDCPEGYVRDAGGNCVPDTGYNSAQFDNKAGGAQTSINTGLRMVGVDRPGSAVKGNPFAVNMTAPGPKPAAKKPIDWRQTLQNAGELSDAFNYGLGAASVAADMLIGNPRKKRENEQRVRMSQMTDALGFAEPRDRGDYVASGSRMGEFRPDQMVANKGMYNAGFYPTFNMPMAQDGGVLLDELSEPIDEIILTESSAAPTRQSFAQDTPVNFTLTDDFEQYAETADRYIKKINPTTDINGQMLAVAAQQAYEKTGKLVPVELALAQLQQEGYLAKGKSKNRPQRTKNPFNVGNTDDGSNKYYNDIQSGINKYFDLMTTQYLNKRTPEQLLENFVNSSGHRYASAKNYEKALKSVIQQIKLKGFDEGGEYELTEDEIKSILAAGGSVEFV